jgi:hypothetical protein
VGEPIYYIVVCSCGGQMKPIAFIDDERPAGKLLRLHSPSRQEIQVPTVSKHGTIVQVEPHDDVVNKLADANLTEVFWSDGHLMVALRCLACGDQAQMSRDVYWNVANALAATVDRWRLIPCSDPDEQRRMIPLGVLNRMATDTNV